MTVCVRCTRSLSGRTKMLWFGTKVGQLMPLVTTKAIEIEQLLQVKGSGGFGRHLQALSVVCGDSKVLYGGFSGFGEGAWRFRRAFGSRPQIGA